MPGPLKFGAPRQLVWLPVGLLLALIAVLMFGVHRLLLPELLGQAQADLRQRGEILAERLRAQLADQVLLLRQLSRSAQLNAAQGDSAMVRADRAQAELNWLLGQHTAFAWLGLLDADGRVWAAAQGRLLGESLAQRPAFVRATQDGIFLGDFQPPAEQPPAADRMLNASPAFDIALRLNDSPGLSKTVLLAQVGRGWLHTLAQHAKDGLSDKGSVQVYLLIGALNGGLNVSGPSAPVVLDGPQAPMDAEVQRWLTTPTTGPAPARFLVHLQTLDMASVGAGAMAPWHVLVVRDRASAARPVQQLTGAIALLGGLAALLLGAAGFWVARRMRRITQPWRALIDAAEQAAGSLSPALGPLSTAPANAEQRADAAPGRDRPRVLHPFDSAATAAAAADAVLSRLATDVRYVRRVLDHLPVGVVLSGRRMDIEYVNATLTQELGYTTDAVRGRMDGEFLCYPADAPALAAQMHAMAASPGALAARFVARHANGSPRAVQWHFVPLFDAAGNFEGAISVVTDIDAETSARRRAAALDQRLHLLLEAAVDHALVLLDDDGGILSWNVGAVGVFGRSAEQAVGGRFEDLFEADAWTAGLPKRLLEHARQDGRAPIEGAQRHASGRRLHVGGTLYAMPAQAWPAAYALIARDLTAQHEAAQRLAASEARLAALVDGASDAIISVDTQGRVERFNPAAELIFGRKAGSVLGEPLHVLLPAADGRGLPMTGFLRSPAGQAQATGRLQGLRADGTELDLEASMSQSQVGGRTTFTAILRDVTSRLQSERSLARYRRELAALSQRLLAQEKETTRRLAQTLHDELGQTITAMRLTFDACRSVFPTEGTMAARLERLNGLIATAYQQVRRALVELRPPLLDDLGLLPALENELAVRRGAHPDVQLLLDQSAVAQDQRWPPSVEYAAFMIAREAVLNALQHAGPDLVEVQLTGQSGQLDMQVLDNGQGLSAIGVHKPGHLGVVGMRERALAIGAELTVVSRSVRGTCVRLSWYKNKTEEMDS